jgi:hypothetical protein
MKYETAVTASKMAMAGMGAMIEAAPKDQEHAPLIEAAVLLLATVIHKGVRGWAVTKTDDDTLAAQAIVGLHKALKGLREDERRRAQ